MNAPDLIDKLWPFLLSLILFIAWLIRLEAKVMYLEQNHNDIDLHHREMEKKIWEKFEKMQESMNEILTSLGRLEGKLEQK